MPLWRRRGGWGLGQHWPERHRRVGECPEWGRHRGQGALREPGAHPLQGRVAVPHHAAGGGQAAIHPRRRAAPQPDLAEQAALGAEGSAEGGRGTHPLRARGAYARVLPALRLPHHARARAPRRLACHPRGGHGHGGDDSDGAGVLCRDGLPGRGGLWLELLRHSPGLRGLPWHRRDILALVQRAVRPGCRREHAVGPVCGARGQPEGWQDLHAHPEDMDRGPAHRRCRPVDGVVAAGGRVPRGV
mmetsp:Transcript_136030/g.422652  ORF Transcript_136030/g.422652 Transcript_136030/m.422652 type:complete len:245 (+) Transcript_136030:657-1391(+)